MYVISDSPNPSRMVCFGASGTCVQVMLDLVHQAQGAPRFSGYVADRFGSRVHADGHPVSSLEEVAEWGDVGIVVPIHDPRDRRSVFTRIRKLGIPILGSRGLPHLSHPAAALGEGVIVSSTTRVGFATTIGNASLALGDLIAHDVTVGEYCTFAAGSIVLGHVNIGDDVFVGAGAIIKNGTSSRPLNIGTGAVIGVGAVVDRDVPPGAVVISPRARPLREALS